jgi:S1-C subfamily serine protease
MSRHIFLPMLLLLSAAEAALAQERGTGTTGDSSQSAACKLQQATVTVRIWDQPKDATEKPAVVTVCSGLCIRDGFIITAAIAGSDSPIRLTLSGGKQADAKICVIDEYSGLALLKADTASLTPLAFSDSTPAVGSELLAAAAWGLEPPLVSRGIVGGIDRKHPSSNYPPLMQCDCITSSTSTGSGLVDRDGKFVGVIVAVDREFGGRGWSYAVPVSHVERILRVADEQKGDAVTIVKRRRPLVGMVLEQNGDAVLVERVTPGGPAEKAGMKPGDEVVATDGVAIRSVYQAVLPTLHKQPGDTTVFRVHREGMWHNFSVTLGGGVEISSAPAELLADLVQPKVRLSRGDDGAIVTNRNRTAGPAVAVLPPLPDDAPPTAAPTAADKIALLERALARYQAVIELQQKQLADEQKHRQEQETQLQSLRAEIESLRKAIAK